MKPELGIGLESSDRSRAEVFIKRFAWHVTPGKLVVCGGLATRFHLALHNISFPKRSFNDLDLLIEKPNDIKPSILADFLLYHYHPPGVDDPVETSYFFYAFVDPIFRLKVDVFPYRWSSPERFVKARLKDLDIWVVGIEDQLIQCLYDVSRISLQQKVDPKQLKDVEILLKIVNIKLVKKIWEGNNHPSYPRLFEDALNRARKLKKTQPDWWQEKPYRQPKPFKCSRCQNRPEFPITDMKKIYKVLGHVE